MTVTTSPSRPRRIVVGYDASPASRAALAQAAHRAGEDGRVYILHAYSLPANGPGTTNHQHLVDLELERAQARVERLDEEDGADLQGVEWEVELIGGRPARAIASVATAREADEIIIGTRGFGRARALLGSVAHELIHLAACPVTVIPQQALDRAAELARAEVAS